MGREAGFKPTQTAPEAKIIKRNVAENIFDKIFGAEEKNRTSDIRFLLKNYC